MTEEEIKEAMAAALSNAPRVAGVSWPMTVAAATLRALEKRMPGFMLEVKAELEGSAERMSKSGEQEDIDDLPSMRELIDSWVFMPAPSSPAE